MFEFLEEIKNITTPKLSSLVIQGWMVLSVSLFFLGLLWVVSYGWIQVLSLIHRIGV